MLYPAISCFFFEKPLLGGALTYEQYKGEKKARKETCWHTMAKIKITGACVGVGRSFGGRAGRC